MTLQEAIAELSGINNKGPGKLIKADDWNLLVDAVSLIGGELALSLERLEDVQSRTESLEATVEDQQERLERLEPLEPLLENYIVRTRCERVNYALGEVCVITATVERIDGEAFDELPWVDFISSWGRLRAASGFTSRAGVGDNSLSVQVNAQGIAQVQLRSDHTEGFSETEETEIEFGLQNLVDVSNLSIAQTILQAPTPTDSRAQAAYRSINFEYERTDTNAMQAYLDTYFVRMPEYQIKPLRPNIFTTWRDYRATVMAMAKPDGDPTTADYSRGASSIQITFRDWVSPWINDYILDLDFGIAETAPALGPIFALEPELAIPQTELFIAEGLLGKGVIGRQKQFEIYKSAFGVAGSNVTDPAMNLFKDQTIHALAMQEANDVNQWVYSANSQAAAATPAATAFFGAQKQSAAVETNVVNLSTQVQQTEDFRLTMAGFEGRMQAAESVGINIDQRLNSINDSVKAINVIDETSIQFGVNNITSNIELITEMLNTTITFDPTRG